MDRRTEMQGKKAPKKDVGPGARVREAKARDTRFSKVEQCVGLCGDFREAAVVLALGAADRATPRDGAVRALALLLRNWERLLEECPKTGGGEVNPHGWLKVREKYRHRDEAYLDWCVGPHTRAARAATCQPTASRRRTR